MAKSRWKRTRRQEPGQRYARSCVRTMAGQQAAHESDTDPARSLSVSSPSCPDIALLITQASKSTLRLQPDARRRRGAHGRQRVHTANEDRWTSRKQRKRMQDSAARGPDPCGRQRPCAADLICGNGRGSDGDGGRETAALVRLSLSQSLRSRPRLNRTHPSHGSPPTPPSCPPLLHARPPARPVK